MEVRKLLVSFAIGTNFCAFWGAYDLVLGRSRVPTASDERAKARRNFCEKSIPAKFTIQGDFLAGFVAPPIYWHTLQIIYAVVVYTAELSASAPEPFMQYYVRRFNAFQRL